MLFILRPTHYEDHVIQEILRDTCSLWLFLKWVHSLQYMGQESGGPGNQKEISVSE